MKFRRFLVFVLLVVAGITAFAQEYERVDAVIHIYPKKAESPEMLAGFINRDFNTEADKIRAIYGWIINNIAYDPAEYKALDYSFTTVAERNKKQEKFRFKLIDRVLEKNVAVCEGYAFLFERLCELTGVSSYLVRGDSKASLNDIGRKYEISHMWNVAYADGKPYLFDATWGAGKYNGKFIKDPTYRYFMADPGEFIFTHYPQMEDDKLLEASLNKATFESMPLIVDPELADFQRLEPSKGILSRDESLGYWQFIIPIKKETALTLGLNGKNPKAVKAEWLADRSAYKYELEIPLWADFLIFYFDDRPGLVYKIK